MRAFIPDTLNTAIYDEIIPVENEDAMATGKEFAHTEGVLVGVYFRCELFWAATQVANRPEYQGKTIVTYCFPIQANADLIDRTFCRIKNNPFPKREGIVFYFSI